VKAVCVCFFWEGGGETKWGCGVVVYVKIMIEVFSLNLLGKWLLFIKLFKYQGECVFVDKQRTFVVFF
jgi:hypothetical protein